MLVKVYFLHFQRTCQGNRRPDTMPVHSTTNIYEEGTVSTKLNDTSSQVRKTFCAPLIKGSTFGEKKIIRFLEENRSRSMSLQHSTGHLGFPALRIVYTIISLSAVINLFRSCLSQVPVINFLLNLIDYNSDIFLTTELAHNLILL